MIQAVKEILPIIAFVALIAIIGIAMGICIEKEQCRISSDKMEFESSFGPLQGCMIRKDGKWIPLRSFRVLND